MNLEKVLGDLPDLQTFPSGGGRTADSLFIEQKEFLDRFTVRYTIRQKFPKKRSRALGKIVIFGALHRPCFYKIEFNWPGGSYAIEGRIRNALDDMLGAIEHARKFGVLE